MRTAFALIIIGSLAFMALSRDLIAEITGKGFLGINPVQAESLKLDADFSTPNLNGVTRFESSTFNGHVNITVGTEPKLTITKRGNVEVKTERRGSVFVITSRKMKPSCWGCRIDVDATVPVGLELQLETSNGAIEVHGGVRELTATTSNGAISTSDTLTGKLTLETSNAGIEVRSARAAVNANTSNGRVRLERVEGQITADTSNSGIILDRVTLPTESSSDATTSNGSIEVIGLNAPNGLRVEGSTSNGGLKITMPGFDVQQDKTDFTATKEGSLSASLRLDTSNGGITVRP